METLFKLTAREAVSRLKNGEVSPIELIDAAEERISKTDAKINALPTLCLDRARTNARRIIEKPIKDAPPQYLYQIAIVDSHMKFCILFVLYSTGFILLVINPVLQNK